jgi:hypothetical protein
MAGADGPPVASYDAKIKDADREHWSFQPIAKPAIPEVRDRAWVRNPIDAFVLAQLEAQGWEPAPAASPLALVRRLSFDLTGLPPTPEDIDAFTADPSPIAYQGLVDRFLASPRYGERWGRHWLDLARFAETNGYERDAIKPGAWRYRDYVIRAFNADKPFDRFLIEQLAGDEMPGSTAETLIATGFLRVGPWDDEPADPATDRFDQLDDLVRTTSEVFLGLTLGCARCHDHKFEPLTQADYYRMVAVFDPLDRPRNGRTELDQPAGTPEEIARQAERDAAIRDLRRDIAGARRKAEREHLNSGRSAIPAEAVAALLMDPSDRGDEPKALAERYQKDLDAELNSAMAPEIRGRIEAAESQIRTLNAEIPDLARGYFLEERPGQPPRTHILLRGQATAPGAEVESGIPFVLAASEPGLEAKAGRTSGRRLALARWMTDRANPLTARVVVNRVWQHHFREGLVRSPSDFGTMGDEPTHPELLDWLAAWFVERGWSIKALHRLIVDSQTYRMATRAAVSHAEEDPDNRLLRRRPYRRLEAEAIRDAMLAVSGQMDDALYGPSVYPEVPRAAIEAHTDPDKIWQPFDERAAARRTIYAMSKRSFAVPMLEVLDLCDATQSAARRNVTSIAPQALTLLNGQFVNRQARHFADRLVREVGNDPTEQVARAYRLALGRPPGDGELSTLVRYLTSEETGGSPAERLARLCRAIFNLNEFVYPD